jgi:hypothetical protein
MGRGFSRDIKARKNQGFSPCPAINLASKVIDEMSWSQNA